MDSFSGWRVYYQDSNGVVSELVGQGGGWGIGSLDSESHKANFGSPIAVSMEASPNLYVFYVDASDDDLTYTTSATGWNGRLPIPLPSIYKEVPLIISYTQRPRSPIRLYPSPGTATKSLSRLPLKLNLFTGDATLLARIERYMNFI